MKKPTIDRRALLAGIAASTGAAAQTPSSAPPTTPPLLAPPARAEQRARAAVTIAPYRYNDVLWENDRVAHRIYARALEAPEPPSGSGIDAWGKRVRWPFMERQLHSGAQHDDHGEGCDFYNVGATRGVGGLGVWYDNKLWTSRNYSSATILENGPRVARFEAHYAPWPVDVVRTVAETRRFELPLGTNFTRLTSTLTSPDAAPLVVGVGLAKRPNNAGAAAFNADRANGAFTAWGAAHPAYGSMGAAILVDPAMIADVREDADNYLVLLNVTPGRPFSYAIGAAWEYGLELRSRGEWEAHVTGEAQRFRHAR